MNSHVSIRHKEGPDSRTPRHGSQVAGDGGGWTAHTLIPRDRASMWKSATGDVNTMHPLRLLRTIICRKDVDTMRWARSHVNTMHPSVWSVNLHLRNINHSGLPLNK